MPRNRPIKPRNRTADGAPRDGKRTARAKQRDLTIRKARATKRAAQGR